MAYRAAGVPAFPAHADSCGRHQCLLSSLASASPAWFRRPQPRPVPLDFMEFNLNQPHDLIFRATLSDQRRADAILRGPPAAVARGPARRRTTVPLDGTFVARGAHRFRQNMAANRSLQVTLRSACRQRRTDNRNASGRRQVASVEVAPAFNWKYQGRHAPGETLNRFPGRAPDDVERRAARVASGQVAGESCRSTLGSEPTLPTGP